MTVVLDKSGEYSFNLEITAYVLTRDLGELDRVRGELLFDCVETLERAGV